MTDFSLYLTLGQTTRKLECTHTWVYTLAARGILPFITTPYGKLYLRSAVEALAEQRKASISRMRLTIK